MNTHWLIVLFSFVFFNQNCFAQQTEVLFENEDAVITSTVIDCIDEANGTAKQYVSLAATNKRAYSIEISFKKDLWYGAKCISCNSTSQEYVSVIQLEGNEVEAGQCGDSKKLLLFKKMLKLKDVRELSHFELKNLNTRKL